MTTPGIVRTIAVDAGIEIEVRKSRFVCDIFRAATESDARKSITEVRDRHWAANHHCSAWRLGEGGRFQRSNDDGEPAGTAGVPMLEMLQRRDLTDTVAVVTRYFGGTRLGVGGLIRAYGASVSAAIGRAGIVERCPMREIEVAIGHGESGRFEHALRASGFFLATVAYNPEHVTFSIHVEPAQADEFDRWVAEASAGRGRTRKIRFVTVERPIASGSA